VQVQVLSPALEQGQGFTASRGFLPCSFPGCLGKILVKSFTWCWIDAAEGRVMASLQERNGSYRILFSYYGKLHSFALGKVEDDKARQVDYLLMRLNG
jgi:hypothetical protein